jgi:hypothetical protein
MTLDANQYRDPMLVLEAKQEAERRRRERNSCLGCSNMARMWGIAYCTIERTQPGDNKMRRCSQYDKEGDK